jgi:GntR family transcriptional regulator
MPQEAQFSTRPLYLQVRDALADRIARREWQPGTTIPNEVELSRQLEVSQGTVRKALSELEFEHLVTRRQGRGTFVNDLTATEAARRFSNLRGADNQRVTSSISHSQAKLESANEQERGHLKLQPQEQVIRVRRIRSVDRRPFMLEDIAMPASRFPGLERQPHVPQMISALAQQFGLLLGGAEEKISIAQANHDVADALSVAPDTPLMHLDRIIYMMDGPPIQWRIAHCHLQDQHYFVEMGVNGRKRKH